VNPLAWVGFFEKVVALQKKHARPGQRIENDLQTNGTLLDEDWLLSSVSTTFSSA